MEEPALRSVNLPVFGTTAPVLHRLLGNTARFSRREAVRITKQPGPPPLDCTPVNNDNNQTFQVFCDFDSEPELAWNLIESFSLSNKHRFQVFAFSLNFS